MTENLLQTKLYVPRLRPFLVPRPPLIQKLNDGLAGKLTLISAPAGFGKTTLLASHVADSGLPVAWLSLDRDDNRNGRFLNYLIAALQQVDPTIGKEIAQLRKTSQQLPFDLVLTSLINHLDTTNREICLVLDDYHLISSQTVHDAVAYLLEHCPRTFHLVVASRSDPPIPLARLRARGQMVELRAADLRFTEAEATQFLNDVMELHLDAGSVSALAARTEGWIAGLQMAALSMRDREDISGFIEGFSGTNRYILDYLLEEVLACEPEEVQDFLLQTAILTRLTGSLCDAVTGNSDGQKMLDRLEKQNLFITPLDDDRRWYRYHHLFADLLQARLYQSAPEMAGPLFSRASEWCEQEGQVNDAVGYAFAARNYERATDLVVKHWQKTMDNGEIDTVWSWLNTLPENMIRNSAPLSAAYCWILWLRGQISAIETHLVDAERAWDELVKSKRVDKNDAVYAELPATLTALRSFVARYQNEFATAIALAERALSLVPETLLPQANVKLKTMIALALATAYDGAGDLEKAIDAYVETIRLSRLDVNIGGVAGTTYRLVGVLRVMGRLRAADAACRDALAYIQAQGIGRLPAAGILHLAMSEILVEWNDLEVAESHLSQGLEIGKWGGRLDAARNAAPARTRLRLAHGDASGALAAVRQAESALGEPPSPLARAELLALKARILVRQGALDEAEQCVKKAARLAGEDRGQTGEMAALAAFRVILAQGDLDEAISELSRSIAVSEELGCLGTAIEFLILRSLALVRQGRTQEAEADLERALALAEPEGYVRVFLDEGQPMQMLLAHWLTHAGTGPSREYAVCLLPQFDVELHMVMTDQKKTSSTDDSSVSWEQALVEPLSPRELEVLHLIALGMTNQEIAQQLVVARGTIKAHAASIYRKLDVANRTEAVARARQLSILP